MNCENSKLTVGRGDLNCGNYELTVRNSKLRGPSLGNVFRVGGSLAARVWDFNEGPPNEGPSGPNPSAGSAAPAAC